METDRRKSQRIRIDAVSQFLVSHDDRFEGDFEGLIENISDEGIGVVVNNPKYTSLVEGLSINNQFFFQAFDEYTAFKKPISDIFQGKAKIVRIEKKNNHYYLGCKIVSSNHDLDEYISRRKMAFYIDGMAIAK